MIRISNIKTGIECGEDEVRAKTLRIIKRRGVRSFVISKKSIDARKKPDIFYVYSVDIEAENEDEILRRVKDAVKIERKKYVFPQKAESDEPIVIVGAGPAGLMCAFLLSQNGYKVILLERGKCVEERKKDVERFWNGGILNPESNVQFGEGGAGTFSDGKLTTGIKDFRIRHVLETFYEHGAPKEILYYSKPHIGTDNLCKMVASIREDIKKFGGDVRFENKLSDIKIKNNGVAAAVVSERGRVYEIPAKNIVLAVGHSARDTFSMLKDKNVRMEQKSFSVGVRIEHLREMIDRSRYGDASKLLPAADYKMAVHLENGRGVYTFCMCPGGSVVASASEEGGVVTNGMSRFARSGENSNSALLVSVTPHDFKSGDPLAGVYFQREIERRAFEMCGKTYKAPCQRVGDFLHIGNGTEKNTEPTYRPGTKWCEMDELFPPFVTESIRNALPLFDKKLKGFADPGAVMIAPETRSSSPVRILRDKETMQSEIKGLYPCGEGAGYAGGITSAAVDGIKIAEKVAADICKNTAGN